MVPPNDQAGTIAQSQRRLGSVDYPWIRYWCPIEATYYLDSLGYVSDRDTAHNPSLLRFKDLARNRTLVLLGEPGIGKSRAMQDEQGAVAAALAHSGNELLWVDLRAYGSEDRLVGTVFEGSQVQRWIAGQHELHLFLDSLDEALIRIETLAPIVLSYLRRWPLTRLYLRIACRTADWPRLLEDGMRTLPDLGEVKTLELVGLTKANVEVAAKSRGLKEEEFTAAIEKQNVVPLAIKPVTLELLLRTVAHDGKLPPTQSELYLAGSRLLCSEPPPGAGELDPAERLAVASRIAALLVYGGKAAVWTGSDLGDVVDSDVPIEDVAGGTERTSMGLRPVTERVVREVLRTSLFSARTTTERLGFAHQTLAEFLAANYVRELPLPQVLSLLLHPGDPEGRIVPQLREPAAWVATLRGDVFQEVAERDPSVLIRSDAAAATAKDRERLVSQLLRWYAAGKILEVGWEPASRWAALRHPGLEKQLRPVIRNRKGAAAARQAAIDIAEANELRGLQSDLLRVALDRRDDLNIRVNGAYAVERIADETTRKDLRPLLDDPADEDDELFGCALRALWPKHLTAGELFNLLHPPRNRNLIGSYSMFLARDLVEDLKPSDLGPALVWVAETCARGRETHHFERLMDAVLNRAVEQFEELGIVDQLARALLTRQRHQHQFLDHPDETEAASRWTRERRRKIVLAMVRQFENPERDRFDVLGGRPSLLDASDAVWVIEQGLAAAGDEQRAWALLGQFVVNWTDPIQVGALYAACEKSEAFRALFGTDFDAVELNSERAAQMKKSYEDYQRWNMPRQPKRIGPPPIERVATQLAASEAGDREAWWRLNREMMLKPEDERYRLDNYLLKADLREFPGWETADEATRARILDEAKRCVTAGVPSLKWIGTNTISEADMAGYRAFRLVRELDPEFLTSLPSEAWRRWAPVLLAAPVNDSEESQAQLVQMAFARAREEVVQTLRKLIEQANVDKTSLSEIRHLGPVWDETLARMLLTEAKKESTQPQVLRALLEALLEHEDSGAISFATEKVKRPGRRGTPARATAVLAAELLMRYLPEEGWTSLRRVIRRVPAFGEEVALALSDTYELRRGGLKLADKDAADFYLWLHRRFPPEKDPPHEGTLPPRALLSDMRDSLLTSLRERGTPQAVEELRRIQRELKLTWLSRTILQAERLVLARSWAPPTPGAILQLAADADRRLVETGDQLLALVSDSLERFDADLQGEQPAAIALWDEVGHGKYRPKPEVVLADAIARHLRTDLKARGLASLREVEIRRGQGGKGERTDVYVLASRSRPQGDADLIRAVLEVKASWSRDLMTAMSGQLVDRYMNRTQLQHGLYVIGWYSCRRWAVSDRRTRRRGQRARIEKQLRAKAKSLAEQGHIVGVKVVDCELR